MVEWKQIWEGWRNNLIPPENLKDLIHKESDIRLSICRKCDENSENKKKKGWTTLRMDEHCTNCGCTLSAKTKCLSCECPLKYWLSVSTLEEEQTINVLK